MRESDCARGDGKGEPENADVLLGSFREEYIVEIENLEMDLL